jgi:hypothetical protein
LVALPYLERLFIIERSFAGRIYVKGIRYVSSELGT